VIDWRPSCIVRELIHRDLRGAGRGVLFGGEDPHLLGPCPLTSFRLMLKEKRPTPQISVKSGRHRSGQAQSASLDPKGSIIDRIILESVYRCPLGAQTPSRVCVFDLVRVG